MIVIIKFILGCIVSILPVQYLYESPSVIFCQHKIFLVMIPLIYSNLLLSYMTTVHV